jgi:tRNA(Met) cytidine acetyltransferase
VHGYEGTGRGFALRFNRCLDRYSNSWKAITLSTPIRFAAGDPLERLVFRMLLLDANAAPDTALQAAGAGKWTIEDIDRDQLLADETALSELFGLLVLAHYRTRPLDLRHLLDGPNLSVYLLRFGPHVAGAALVAQEGGFDADTAQAIWAGRIRPHGHLLPETLAAHQGLAEAPRLRGVRIVRIAVHPLVQRRGFGTRLVGYISERSAERGMDYIGSSFGTSEDVLDFWRGLGWLPVRLSIQADASSGQRSAVMLKALSEAGTRLMAHARERFFAHFPHQLSDSFRELDTALVRELMRAGADSRLDPVTLGVADWKDVEAFALHQRLPEVAIGALWRLACKALMETGPVDGLEEKEATVLVARILQKRSWPECARLADVSGRGPAQAMLRRAAAKLIRYYHGQVAASVDSYPA